MFEERLGMAKMLALCQNLISILATHLTLSRKIEGEVTCCCKKLKVHIYYCNSSTCTWIELYSYILLCTIPRPTKSSLHLRNCKSIWTDLIPILAHFTSLVWRPEPADVVIIISHTFAWWQCQEWSITEEVGMVSH